MNKELFIFVWFLTSNFRDDLELEFAGYRKTLKNTSPLDENVTIM